MNSGSVETLAFPGAAGTEKGFVVHPRGHLQAPSVCRLSTLHRPLNLALLFLALQVIPLIVQFLPAPQGQADLYPSPLEIHLPRGS